MKEIWIDIKDFEGLYQVSNLGRVKSLNYNRTGREVILKAIDDGTGHLYVNLSKNGVQKRYFVHRLVAEAFIPNPYYKPITHHKDHNPANNNVDNLVWLTQEEHKAEHPEIYETSKKACSKRINQFTSDGVFIRAWDSSMDIQRELGYSQGNIISCCKGNYKQAYGYIWKYADKE